MPAYNSDIEFPNFLDYFFTSYSGDFNSEVTNYGEPLPPPEGYTLLFHYPAREAEVDYRSLPNYETALIEQPYEGEPLLPVDGSNWTEMSSPYSGEWWGDNELSAEYAGGYYSYDEEDNHSSFMHRFETGFGYGPDEMKLCEIIFGYYPETYAEGELA